MKCEEEDVLVKEEEEEGCLMLCLGQKKRRV